MRYLIKKTREGVDFVKIPNRAKLIRTKGGYRAKVGKRLGVIHKGFRLTRARSEKAALIRAFN